MITEKKRTHNREYRKNRYHSDPAFREKCKALIAIQRKKQINWFQEYKKTLKCELCEENDWRCLDFHHIDPTTKTDTVSSLARKGNKRKILAEIEKCTILCANCHRKLHSDFDTGEKINIKQVKRDSKCPPKEELEKLIWEIPTVRIAERYGVSDKAVEKWCKKLNVDKPPRGYWRQQEVLNNQ